MFRAQRARQKLINLDISVHGSTESVQNDRLEVNFATQNRIARSRKRNNIRRRAYSRADVISSNITS